MDLAPDTRAERAVYELMPLQAALSGERVRDHSGFVVTLAVRLDMRFRTRKVLLDQCGDIARIHDDGVEWLEPVV